MRTSAIWGGVMIAVVWAMCSPGMAAEPQAKGAGRIDPGIQKLDFGKTAESTPVDLYVLTNAKGTTAKVMTYGAILTELHVADREGKFDDVVLGFDNLKDYL